MNPEKLRDTYGKLVYLLQASPTHHPPHTDDSHEQVTGAPSAGAQQLSLYKILFHFKAVLWSPSSFDHPPTCNAYHIAILLHAHCAIYAPPPTLPLYAIHHTILAMTISCKGQTTALDIDLCVARPHGWFCPRVERSTGHTHTHTTADRAWEVARTIVAPPLSVVKFLWEVFVWRSCRARVCAGVGGVFSVGVSCVRVTC